jgi:DNA repair protein RadD
MSFELREYQHRAENETRSCLAQGLKRVCLYLPTGGGKTLTATSIIGKANARGRRVVMLANRKQLVKQISDVLHRYGIAHGIMQAENTCRLHERVIVGSIDTVAARGLPDDIGLLIIDEAHGVPGNKKYRDLLARYNNLPVIGLTATPFAVGMGKHLPELGGALFEAMVTGATITELVDLGFLVDVDIYGLSEPDLQKVKISKGMDGLPDYQQSQLEEATDRPELLGDILAHWKKLANGKQTVVFACSIPHSRHIVETFQAAGVKAEHIDYHHDDDERAAILGRFERGETTVLSNASLLAEGWDCPATEVMILARPTKSLIRYLQMVGRVLRPAPGKERALLLDHSGSTARLGHPSDELPLYLDDGKPKLARSRSGEREAPLPKKCAKCHYMRPAGIHICPQCGFAPERQSEVQTAAGELVKQERRKPVKKEAGQHIYSQLLGYARNKGYQTGWAYHKYREFTGRNANGLKQVEASPTAEMLNWIKSRAIASAKAREKHHAHH